MYTLPKTPASIPGLTNPEKRALHYFRCRVALEMAAPFNSELWSECVFHLAEQQDFLTSAMVALSAMHESYSLTSTESRAQRRDEAMRFYNKAMRDISRCSELTIPLEPLLVAIVIFHSLESLRGCSQRALQHVLSGLKIINERVHSVGAPQPEPIHNAVLDAFVALQNQVREFSNIYMSRAFDSSRGYQPPCVEHFTSWHEAHTQLEIIYNELYGVLDHCYFLQESSVDLEAVFEAQILPKVSAVTTRVEYWRRGLAELEAARSDNNAARLLLKMYESFILAILGKFPASLGFDNYDPNIASVLQLAEQFLKSEKHSLEGRRPFSLSLGVIPILFILAWRSNSPVIRDRSLALLRQANRREGIWDTKLTFEVAQRVTGLKAQLGAYTPESTVHAELAEITFEDESTCRLTYKVVGGDLRGLPGEKVPPIRAIGAQGYIERLSVAPE